MEILCKSINYHEIYCFKSTHKYFSTDLKEKISRCTYFHRNKYKECIKGIIRLGNIINLNFKIINSGSIHGNK